MSIGYFADRFSKKWVMFASYFVTAATIPLLLKVTPDSSFFLYAFAIMFARTQRFVFWAEDATSEPEPNTAYSTPSKSSSVISPSSRFDWLTTVTAGKA
jgi:hypothetical protein